MPRNRHGKSELREAQRLGELKDRLIAAMAHDLRSPLGSIVVWLELLRSHEREPAATRAVEMIQRGVRDLNGMIGQFLDLSQLLAGKLRLEMHPTDLGAVVDTVLAGAKAAAEERGVGLAGRIDRTLPGVRADAQRLGQAIECLVASAVKATPAGGSVEVALDEFDGRVRLQVRDTGAGIPPDQLPVVFEQFRAGSTAAPGGLGLAIARHVALLHGGLLRASRAGAGQGSLFVLELPLPEPSARLRSPYELRPRRSSARERRRGRGAPARPRRRRAGGT